MEFSRLNGYKVKDETARNEIEQLKTTKAAQTDLSSLSNSVDTLSINKANISDVNSVKEELQNNIDVEKARIDSLSNLPEGSTTGDAELQDIRIAYDGTTYDSAGNSVRGQANKIINNFKDKMGSLHLGIIEKPNGINLFDKYSENIISGWLDDNGGVNSSSGNCISDYIPVEVGKTYSYITNINFYGSSGARKLQCYDENKNFVGVISGVIDTGTGVNTVTCPETTNLGNKYKYARFTFIKANINSVMFVEGDYPGEVIQYYLDKRINVDGVNPLIGKSLYVIGDSICEGVGYTGGYGKIVADNNSMNLTNRGHSGGTIVTGQKFSDGVTERYPISTNLGYNPPECDYVICEGGVNDISLGVAIGTITSGYNDTFDTTTFCGALEHICKVLTSTYAAKKVGFIFPHRMNGKDNYDVYNPLIKQICEKWGVPFLDLSKIVPPLNDISDLKSNYTNNGDGWHPNEMGYKLFYVPKIESWLKSL